MNASVPACAPSADAAFGPVVSHECRDGFDFTIVFEQSIFVLLPAALLLLAAPWRLVHLGKARLKVAGQRFRSVKMTAIGVFAALQLALVILWATRPVGSARLASVSVAAACVSLASSVMSVFLSYAEHTRSPSPSSLLNGFLLVSVLLDAALLRSLWLSDAVGRALQAVFSASVALKALLVVLEAREKTRFLDGRYSPSETAGIYSRAVFAWVTPLLRTGFKRLLTTADLYSLDADMDVAVVGERFWGDWNRKNSESTARHNYALLWQCLVTLRWPLLAAAIPRLALIAFTICQPLAVNKFLQFLDDLSQPVDYGYGLLGAYGIIYLGIAMSQALYWQLNGRTVSMMRGVLVSAVFREATSISITATDNAAAVTLMSSDVDVITRAFRQVHELWANVLQVAIATWLLSREIGYAAAGPMIVCAGAFGATMYYAPFGKKTRGAWFAKTQQRIGITSAMLGHIKSIKMSGLGQHLSTIIAGLRVDEIAASRPFRVLGSITSSIGQIPNFISPVIAFAMFQGVAAQTGEALTATRLFAALSFITLLAQPLFLMLDVVFEMSAALAAFERIQKFLSAKTRVDYRELDFESAPPVTRGEESSDDVELQRLKQSGATPSTSPAHIVSVIELQDTSFGWTPERNILHNISLTVDQSRFVIILGPVASGKTTLLKGILGEVTNTTGLTRLRNGRLSWCDQSPWIVNQTVRDNIIGYSHYDQALYDQVIQACELEEDLTQLPQGDMTLVGSKGLTLSGGQKQRVSLARAVYSRPQLALVDDIFSGLDNKTAGQIFKNLFAPRRGLLRQWGCTIVLATQSVRFIPFADHIFALGDGTVMQSGTYEQLKSSAGLVSTLLENEIRTGSFESTPDAELEDRSDKVKTAYKSKETIAVLDKRRQLGDSTVYRSYFGSIGVQFVVILLTLELAWGFLQTFPTVWLNFWAASNGGDGTGNTAYYLSVYAVLQVIGTLWFALLIWFMLVQIAAKSGISLHQRLLSAVLKAPLSVFASTDLGSITTRFSQDIGFVDNQLPLSLVVTIASFLEVIGMAGLLAASTYYVAISFPFLAALYYFLQRGYLRTSRQLRLLDLEEKAPVYTQFLETLAGLSTIRAFGWSEAAILKNHELVNRSQKPFFLLIMVQRWLVLVLDLTTTAQALLVVGFAIYLRGSVSVGLTGVALVQLISMSQVLSTLIQFWVQLETSIAAVARIGQFATETPEENLPGETHEPPSDWPAQGHIVIDNITASYDGSGDIKALDGVSLEIKAGEKVGICGRTGSGKSSLLLLLLRLLDPSSGTLTIDSLPLTSMPRETIRSRLIAVSQDQFVLPGSVRENADPFSAFSDDVITDALEAVGLSGAVEAHGGLDAKFSEDMLSHGQKQLFFLARALLRKESGNLVLLDEATSSVDQETEKKVRKVIDSHFSKHTVVAIAHRLDTVIDFDQVVVMEKGFVVETGSPTELVQQSGSRFKALWDASRESHAH